jgi:hypothetical protein
VVLTFANAIIPVRPASEFHRRLCTLTTQASKTATAPVDTRRPLSR